MQPRAGPWLSPKVVTVNSLPMVLPDMRSLSAAARGQLLAPQQEHAAAAARELQPHERQAREGAPHRPFRVTDLDHQQPPGTQMRAAPDAG